MTPKKHVHKQDKFPARKFILTNPCRWLEHDGKQAKGAVLESNLGLEAAKQKCVELGSECEGLSCKVGYTFEKSRIAIYNFINKVKLLIVLCDDMIGYHEN